MLLPYIILSAVPMFVCLFWAVVFLARYHRADQSSRILFWFMFIAACLYFGHFVVFNHIRLLIPLTDTLYSFATLSVYPVYYLYILSLTGKYQKIYVLILIPPVIIAAIIGGCYLLTSGEELNSMIQYTLYEKGMLPTDTVCRISWRAHQAMKYVILCEVLSTLPLGFHELSLFRKKVRRFYSNTRHRDLKGIKNLLWTLVLTSCLSIAADLTGRVFFIDSLVLAIAVLVPFSVMLFLIGYIGNMQTFTASDLQKEELRVKMETGISEPIFENERTDWTDEQKSKRQQLKENIENLMITKNLFLNPDLKLSDIASQLNSNRTYIYEALKYDEPLSFTDYVNRFRIGYSIELMKNGNKSIEEIYCDSGFASKVVFYRNFKKITGMTPGQYQNMIHHNIQ